MCTTPRRLYAFLSSIKAISHAKKWSQWRTVLCRFRNFIDDWACHWTYNLIQTKYADRLNCYIVIFYNSANHLGGFDSFLMILIIFRKSSLHSIERNKFWLHKSMLNLCWTFNIAYGTKVKYLRPLIDGQPTV